MKKKSTLDKNIKILYGRHVAAEYLKNQNSLIEKLVLSSGNQKTINTNFITMAKNRHIHFEIWDNYKFAEKTKHIKATQGILLYIKTKKYTKNTIIEYSNHTKKKDMIIMLDHIEDTNNLGSILRIAGFFGVELVIAPNDRAVDLTPAVEKIAAGALAFVKYVNVNNLNHIIEILKKQDYWIVGTSLKQESQNINQFQFPDKSVLIIGNEHKGLSRLVEKNCDFLVKISGQGPVQSLNAAVSTAVFLNQFYS